MPQSRDIIVRIRKWAIEVPAFPEGALGKAIAYMTKIWSGLLRFLEDPRIPLDNNRTRVFGINYSCRSRCLTRRVTERGPLPHQVCYPQRGGGHHGTDDQTISTDARHELVRALAERYRNGSRDEKRRILDEFVAVTGYHRKHAIRVLNSTATRARRPRAPRLHLYDKAVRA